MLMLMIVFVCVCLLVFVFLCLLLCSGQLANIWLLPCLCLEYAYPPVLSLLPAHAYDGEGQQVVAVASILREYRLN